MSNNVFDVIVLGSEGGFMEGDLSGYMICKKDSSNFVCLDAGTVFSGIAKAYKNGCFENLNIKYDDELSPIVSIFQNNIKSYVITHAHLDHTAGLVLGSPADIEKEIYATDFTLDFIKSNLFNWRIWPNMGNDGNGFLLSKYKYNNLKLGEEIEVLPEGLFAKTYILSHGEPYKSSSVLLRSEENYLLYIGDTGSDMIEQTTNLEEIWKDIAPLVKSKKLKGIFIESSYTNSRKDEELFGHLRPNLVVEEMKKLGGYVDESNPLNCLEDLKLIITGIKPSLKKGVNSRDIIKQELEDLNMDVVIPIQGMHIEL